MDEDLVGRGWNLLRMSCVCVVCVVCVVCGVVRQQVGVIGTVCTLYSPFKE